LILRRSRRVVAVGAALIVILVAAGCNSGSPSESAASTSTISSAQFYATPSPFPSGPPGTLVRSEPMAAPQAGAQAWRVMYVSTGERHEPVVVTGMVIASTGPAPVGGRPVVSWAHPTTGINDECAPSSSASPFDDVQGLSQFLSFGWVVVATDYQGLGTDGPHPYLAGDSEAHGVIDIVRAATQIPQAGASTKYFAFGHSQGGQAALFTGQIAFSYAPDLTLLGVAAAAPSGDLVAQIDEAGDTAAYAVISSYLTMSWQEVFGMDPSEVVSAGSLEQVHHVADQCVLGGTPEANNALVQTFDADPVVATPMFTAALTTSEPWMGELRMNSPSGHIAVPLLIAQGTADRVIPPDTTANLVAMYAANDTQVTEQLMDGVVHTQAAVKSLPFVVPFFQGLAG
jgi:pimeloyl-ACP methyl ester carboxylesterase